MVSGGGTNLQAVIDACQQGQIDGQVVKVVSSNSKAYALERAERHGIPSACVLKKDFATAQEYDKAKHRALLESGADIVVLAGYLSILPMETFAVFPNRIVNTHPALIPSFCGMGMYGERVHQAVIDAGVKVSGCTVHFAEAGVDTGPIILQETVPVNDDDDAHSLAARILPVEHRLLVKAVSLLAQDKLRVEGRRVVVVG